MSRSPTTLAPCSPRVGSTLKLTIVLINNEGGGIFDFLPVAEAKMARDPTPGGCISGEQDDEATPQDLYTRHIATPTGLDFARAATLYGLSHERVADVAGLSSRAGAGLGRRPTRRSSKCAAPATRTSSCTGRFGAPCPGPSASEPRRASPETPASELRWASKTRTHRPQCALHTSKEVRSISNPQLLSFAEQARQGRTDRSVLCTQGREDAVLRRSAKLSL